MKEVLKKASQALLFVPMLALAFSFISPLAVSAASANPTPSCSNVSGGVSDGAKCVAPTSAQAQLFGEGGVFMTVTNILIFIIGAIAVIMLIVGGIRYTLSQGDQSAITSAKNTILYAIIGIVVAVLAFGAVNFITSQLPTGA